MTKDSRDKEQYDLASYHFFKQLCAFTFVDAIYLYGSRAYPNNPERSDIDLAIVCPYATTEEWLTVKDVIHKADTLLEIDCVRFDELPSYDKLKQNIIKNGKIMYKKEEDKPTWYDSYIALGTALQRLEEVLKEPENQTSYVIDATIQRFEFCFELFWKTLKKICQSEGHEVNSPRSALQKAYAMKLIDDEKAWLEMMEDRNLTSHTYQEELAKEIYHHIQKYFPTMKAAYATLKDKYDQL